MSAATWPKVCPCGASYSREQWLTLPLVGYHEDTEPERPGEPEHLELRNCTRGDARRCYSTMAVVLTPGQWRIVSRLIAACETVGVEYSEDVTLGQLRRTYVCGGDDIEARASAFATEAHAGQVRKYTGEPYVTHPAAVAAIVRTTPGHTPAMLAAAWLHDVVEDCGVSLATLEAEFGAEVAQLVDWLTHVTADPSAGNRAARKALDRAKLARAPDAAKTIKLADIIDNTSSIVERDPKFAKVYLAEMRLLLPFLRGGDATLWERAGKLVQA